jgi:hypothetical protein
MIEHVLIVAGAALGLVPLLALTWLVGTWVRIGFSRKPSRAQLPARNDRRHA